MSVKVTLHCQVKDNRFGDLHQFLEENLPNVRNFKGCEDVTVLFDHTSYELLLDEMWIDVNHHKTYISFITENGVLNSLASFFEAPPTIRYFFPVSV